MLFYCSCQALGAQWFIRGALTLHGRTWIKHKIPCAGSGRRFVYARSETPSRSYAFSAGRKRRISFGAASSSQFVDARTGLGLWTHFGSARPYFSISSCRLGVGGKYAHTARHKQIVLVGRSPADKLRHLLYGALLNNSRPARATLFPSVPGVVFFSDVNQRSSPNSWNVKRPTVAPPRGRQIAPNGFLLFTDKMV